MRRPQYHFQHKYSNQPRLCLGSHRRITVHDTDRLLIMVKGGTSEDGWADEEEQEGVGDDDADADAAADDDDGEGEGAQGTT